MSDDGPPPAKLIKTNLCDERNSTIEGQAICETKLLDMNDDCLNELLGHLNVIDLSSIGRVCKLLKELAMSYFTSKYKVFDFSLFKYQLISSQEAKDILLLFGPFITSMKVERKVFHDHETAGYVEEMLLKDIAVCCATTLHSLALKNCHFTQSAVESLNMLSDSLKDLSLDGCVMERYCVFHLTNFTSLTTLTISNSLDCNALMDTYPALRHLVLSKVSLKCQSILQHFIVKHKQLVSLTIRYGPILSSDLFPIIAKNTKSLKKISFTYFEFKSTNRFQHNILYLSELQNLEKLRMCCDSRSIGYLLAKMASKQIAMKHLQLQKGIIDSETIDAIIQMKALTQLAFTKMFGLTNEHLIKLANELPKLRVLQIFSEPNITTSALKEVIRMKEQLSLKIDKFCLDLKIFKEFLDIVKEHRNGNLKMAIYGRDEQVSVPPEIIQENRKWILVNFIRQL